ncbi:MAG: GNAT family N-acetyltransferase [Steroidobacteraceae bacterium]
MPLTVSVRDARACLADRLWIEQVYRDYLDDLAPLSTGIFPVLGEVGHRGPDQMAHWLNDRSASALVIARSAEPVGFAVVIASRHGGAQTSYRMAEFFVSRESRGQRVGTLAAQLILDRFAGPWEVTEDVRNPGAVRFWRRVLAAYTGGRFEERVADGEVRQTFKSGPASNGARNRPV